MARRANDWYPTPASLTLGLLHDQRINIIGTVAEPCAGDGAISKVLRQHGHKVREYDIDPQWGHQIQDARTHRVHHEVTEVISNPPFNVASEIVQNFLHQYRAGEIDYMAFLLRITFLEPVPQTKHPEKSRLWLANQPPDRILVMPRTSFTGDGKVDSATVAWMIWGDHHRGWHRGIRVYTAAQLRELESGGRG